MDGQQTRPLVYAGSYTACCEGGGEAPGGGSPQSGNKIKAKIFKFTLFANCINERKKGDYLKILTK
jgi:hypothetical protein